MGFIDLANLGTPMEKVILPLAACLIQTEGDDVPLERSAVTAAIIRERILGMPILLRTAMTVLVYVFDISGLCINGCFFRGQTREKQLKQITLWQRSSIAVCRDFIQFHQKMSNFIYYSLCPNSV